MFNQEFDKLIQIQVEIADQIIATKTEINHYDKLEKDMVTKRERALHKYALGCKDEQTETDFAIHYIQVKLQQKKELYKHLTAAFQHRSKEYIQVLGRN